MKQTWNKESLLTAYPRFEAQPDFYLGRMADAEKALQIHLAKKQNVFSAHPAERKSAATIQTISMAVYWQQQ